MTDTAQAVADAMLRIEQLKQAPEATAMDPVRLHYVQAMARRAADAPTAVQEVLVPKLHAALKALASGLPGDGGGDGSEQFKPRNTPAAMAVEPSLLAELNRQLQAAQTEERPELKSAERFRETWALISAETEVEQAVFKAPANAGPLNAHRLVLRALGYMRELSPEYLRQCIGQVETLMWLDQAYQEIRQPARKASGTKASGKVATKRKA